MVLDREIRWFTGTIAGDVKASEDGGCLYFKVEVRFGPDQARTYYCRAYKEASRQVVERLRPGDRVFVWGGYTEEIRRTGMYAGKSFGHVIADHVELMTGPENPGGFYAADDRGGAFYGGETGSGDPFL